MVLLTITPAAKAVIDEYISRHGDVQGDEDQLQRLRDAETGSPVEHSDLITISKYLKGKHNEESTKSPVPKAWRLDSLLKGAVVYQPPPPPKPEPSDQYKALMARLRKQEEQRAYDRMLNPLPEKESFAQRYPNAPGTFNPNTYHGQIGLSDDSEETTYQDVDRQVALIINVLVSIVACAVALWIVARHWSVPRRLALAMGGSLAVAAAEVVIYLGYIRKIEDAKGKEVRMVERKEVGETWVIEKASGTAKGTEGEVRYRKGRHR